MKFTNEQLTKAKAAKSAEELLTLAKENGVTMTVEEAAKYFAELHKAGSLSDDELNNVSGGGCGDPYEDYETYLRCANCGNEEHWDGDFSEGKYECSGCHLNTLVAIRVVKK